MELLKDWWSSCSGLSLQVMKLMALGVGADPNAIADSHSYGTAANESAIRVNFYPRTNGKCKSE